MNTKSKQDRKRINRVKGAREYKFGRYNHWTIVALAPEHKEYGMVWAVCDCGEKKIVSYRMIVSGRSKSCCYYGLMENWHVKHGCARIGKKTPEYLCWQEMRRRCFDKSRPAYKDYGGRGITVCDRWMRFENFIEDMGEKPSPKHSIDRIDNNGNYEPSNCRWATWEEQGGNTRKSIVYERKGVSKTQRSWAKHFGVTPKTIRDAVKKYGVEEMFNRIELVAKHKNILGVKKLNVNKIYDYENQTGHYRGQRFAEVL